MSKQPTTIQERPVTHAFIAAFVPWAKQLENPFTGTAREVRREVAAYWFTYLERRLDNYPQRDGHVSHVLMNSDVHAWLYREHRIDIAYERKGKHATVWTVTPPAKKSGATEETSWVGISLHIPLALMNFIRNKAAEEGQTLSAALTNAILHYKADLEQTGEPTIQSSEPVLTREYLEAVIAKVVGKPVLTRKELSAILTEAREHREVVTSTLSIIQGFVERIYERLTKKWWQR